MRATVGRLRSNRDAYFETHEVDDEELWKMLEETSDDNPAMIPTGIQNTT